MHSDHILELGGLLYTAWTSGLESKVDVYGPEGVSDYWTNFLKSMNVDYDNRLSNEGRIPLRDLIKIKQISNKPFKIGTLEVFAIEVPHPPLRNCFALKFKAMHHNHGMS